MRTAILSLALIVILAHIPSVQAQNTPPSASPTPRPKKVLTPDQIAYQQASKEYSAQIATLRAAAIAAFSAEIARENAPSCTNAVTTYDNTMCLAHEDQITGGNYKAFTQAVRAMLALPAPAVPGLSDPIMGPSGQEATPATDTAAFDKAEAAWQLYSTAECSAVDTYWRGGTIVNSKVLECDLRQSRARLHELNTVYSVAHPR